ncbi:hypothetical protein KUC_2180 [Vreelandella boliviensis LC1]|uniref:Uncharacterized protein n=1 Tax=Vreelandella boliviensis LC1 TaxID=1072583 RepID=A0A7U9GGS0_9GAMM|nr:hypothetical protein KUC_2180 [Halomonas boliviensis LC1]
MMTVKPVCLPFHSINQGLAKTPWLTFCQGVNRNGLTY